jgi:ubiquinone/menaquinone biosynthesis C-methylase UbiE
LNVESLINHLEKISKVTDEEWMNSLNNRKLRELTFHDKLRDSQFMKSLSEDTYDKFYANRKYYKTVSKSNEYVLSWIKENAKDKIFLDYACGYGHNVINAAEAGAKLAIGLDVSNVTIKNAEKEANKLELNNIFFLQADAENTKLPTSSIDTIICSGILHHLDLSSAFPELRRILAPKGKILAVEALNYNPIIKLYRMYTPNMRTEWEKSHILSLKDVEFAKRFFNLDKIRY